MSAPVGRHLADLRVQDLADGAPASMAEARHLWSCDACRDEIEAYRWVVRLVQEACGRGAAARVGAPLLLLLASLLLTTAPPRRDVTMRPAPTACVRQA